MNDTKLGELIKGPAQRDCVHIAIAPVEAGEFLAAGVRVMLVNGKAWFARKEPSIGIVDPFLNTSVEAGQRFWLLLYQQTITGMRHVWRHSAFPDENELRPNSEEKPMSEKDKSIEWLKEQARYCGVSYERMMSFIERDDYMSMGENETYKDVDAGAFKKHVEIVTGKKDVYPPFTCSC